MKRIVIFIVIIISTCVGAITYLEIKLADQKELTKKAEISTSQANEKVQQLKEQDETLFNYYRDVINSAADMIECGFGVKCLNDLTDKVNIINGKVQSELRNREKLVGAEQ